MSSKRASRAASTLVWTNSPPNEVLCSHRRTEATERGPRQPAPCRPTERETYPCPGSGELGNPPGKYPVEVFFVDLDDVVSQFDHLPGDRVPVWGSDDHLATEILHRPHRFREVAVS